MTKDDHHALAHLHRVSAAADMTRSIEFPSKKKPDANTQSLFLRYHQLLSREEKMKLHQPPTPACAPNTLNLPPKHPGTTGARGPSSSTGDVKPLRRRVFVQLAQDKNPAASKCSPLVWRSRLLEKASRLQEGRMGSVVTDVLGSTLLLQVAPRFAALFAGAVDVPRWSWIGLVVRYMQAELRGLEDDEDTEREDPRVCLGSRDQVVSLLATRSLLY
ncbi:hypothetical protein FB45DRAFT_1052076 [Roridomyces roridus]|uniref:Uncharacterized protein n=1 Tax=Roridomyces roridus TaxID=1738132 RepID=A0AAD7CHW8_9AGAR|nr:hypothetical protein FB45DRAFT_1052076 [Roridomyces roridus]